jgi:hypothetical protein
VSGMLIDQFSKALNAVCCCHEKAVGRCAQDDDARILSRRLSLVESKSPSGRLAVWPHINKLRSFTLLNADDDLGSSKWPGLAQDFISGMCA